jgi:hypothetical protein
MGEWGDPVTCAIYARENGLLDQPGWKRFKHIAKNEKKFTRIVNQAKLMSFHTAPKYKYGYEIPRTYEQAKIRKMGTPYGETPPFLNQTKSMNTSHLLIKDTTVR